MLKILDPESKFDIDVANRIGKRQVCKIRPIVAKFVRREHKNTIQQIAQKRNLRDSPFNVADVECLRTCLEDVEFISFVRSYDLFFVLKLGKLLKILTK